MDNQETLCRAISASWGSSHASPTYGDWRYRWLKTQHKIEGYQDAIIHFARGTYDELEEDLILLWGVAHYHEFYGSPLKYEE
jgi:hypothetical protein